MKKNLVFLFAVLLASLSVVGQNVSDTALLKRDVPLVYKFNINDEIDPSTWRIAKQSIEAAERMEANYILLELNTYGGLLDAADSIRTKILNCKIPVYVFVNNNAASAGALISLACDKIFMRPGSSIGAATVVNQSGEVVPDKYQSYMRALMRSTAEAHGRDTIISGTDTTYRWRRTPQIAEAMVDPSIRVAGVIDSGKVLTFTVQEAIANGFCEGEVETDREAIEKAGVKQFEIYEYVPSSFERMMGVLVNPYLQGILVMIILGGIYFELQTPGVGFPIAAAIIAALVYFAPLYMEGIAENWEIMLFILGVILLGIELIAFPGFGLIGIAGIVLMVAGLVLSMIDNIVFEFDGTGTSYVVRALSIVLVAKLSALFVALYLGKQWLHKGGLLGKLVLESEQKTTDGYIGVDNSPRELIGRQGITTTALRPAGVVEIGGEQYDARSVTSFVEKGVAVEVVNYEAGQIYVRKIG